MRSARGIVAALKRHALRAVKNKRNQRAVGRFVTGKVAPALSRAIAGMGKYHLGKRTSKHKFHGGSTMSGSGMRSHRRHPRMSTRAEGEQTIEHSEFIGNLVSAGTNNTFISQSYGVNAANSGTFPWLSATAINFQNYKFSKLVFEYRPLVSESTSTSTGALLSMGKVVLAAQYESQNGPYNSSQTAENSEGSVSCKPSEKMLCGIECNPRMNPLGVYYCSGQNSLTVGVNSTDIRMQNVCIFTAIADQVPTNGSTPIALGELWVHYKVHLYKPQLNAGLSNVLSAHYATNTATGAPASSFPFGANCSIANGIQPTAANGNYLQLEFDGINVYLPLEVNIGRFMCVYHVDGTSNAGALGFQVNPIEGITVLQAWCNNTQYDNRKAAVGPIVGITGGGESLVCGFIIDVNAPGSQLAQFSITLTNPPTGGIGELFVTPYNSSFV